MSGKDDFLPTPDFLMIGKLRFRRVKVPMSGRFLSGGDTWFSFQGFPFLCFLWLTVFQSLESPACSADSGDFV
jgi:hypothetical protein